jgi:hypothetical protein
MDRRGHAMQGMDRVYTHVTTEMRQELCDVLEELWREAVTQRHAIDRHSQVPLLDGILAAYEASQRRAPAKPGIRPKTARKGDLAP